MEVMAEEYKGTNLVDVPEAKMMAMSPLSVEF
jgi:hypothetical protein